MDELTGLLLRATEGPPEGLEARIASALAGETGAGPRRSRGGRGRSVLAIAALVVVLVLVAVVAAGVRRSSDLEVSTNRIGQDPTVISPTPENVATFCAAVAQSAGRHPAGYVGSPAQLRAVTRQAELAPITIRTSAEAYRRYLALGVVDPDDPDSQRQLNWPPGVRAAVEDLSRYTSTVCPGAAEPMPDPPAPDPHPGTTYLAEGRASSQPWWLTVWPSEDDLPVGATGSTGTTVVHREGYCIGVTTEDSGGSGGCTYAWNEHEMATTYSFTGVGVQDFAVGSATGEVIEVRVYLRTGAVRIARPVPIPGSSLSAWVVPLPTAGPHDTRAGAMRPLEAIDRIVAVRPGVDQQLFP